jgi:hypothetical protein
MPKPKRRRPITDEESAASLKKLQATFDTFEQRFVDARMSDPDQRDIVKDILNQMRGQMEEWVQLMQDPLAGFDPQVVNDHPAQVLAELKRLGDIRVRKAIKLMREFNDFT